MILMHKDIPVADVTVKNGSIIAVNSIFNKEHYPVGAMTQHFQLAEKFLDKWQKMRTIPKDRQNANKIIEKIGCSLQDAALSTVSLTDCYWFSPNSEPFWDNINYHDNYFSENYVRNLLFGQSYEIDFCIPDFLTDGVLEKYWVYIDNTPTLLKFGNLGQKENNILCANEIIASKIAGLMNIPHVEYFPVTLDKNNEIICGCKTFIKDNNSEFVNALQIHKDGLMKNKNDLYTSMCNIGMKQFLYDIIVFDFIIGNTDRHEKNFGVIRNPDTLEIISSAPLFDNGTSLGWNGEFDIKQLSMKPFDNNAIKQLEIADISKVNIPNTENVCEIIKDVYKIFSISDEHCDNVQNMIKNSINIVKNL